jgi:hypothetical protein
MRGLPLSALALAITLAVSLAHASSFEFSTLDVPKKFRSPCSVAAYRENDDGAMVGEFNMGSVNPGFVCRDRHFATLDLTAAIRTQAFRINSMGIVAGACSQGNASCVFVASLSVTGAGCMAPPNAHE